MTAKKDTIPTSVEKVNDFIGLDFTTLNFAKLEKAKSAEKSKEAVTFNVAPYKLHVYLPTAGSSHVKADKKTGVLRCITGPDQLKKALEALLPVCGRCESVVNASGTVKERNVQGYLKASFHIYLPDEEKDWTRVNFGERAGFSAEKLLRAVNTALAPHNVGVTVYELEKSEGEDCTPYTGTAPTLDIMRATYLAPKA